MILKPFSQIRWNFETRARLCSLLQSKSLSCINLALPLQKNSKDDRFLEFLFITYYCFTKTLIYGHLNVIINIYIFMSGDMLEFVTYEART